MTIAERAYGRHNGNKGDSLRLSRSCRPCPTRTWWSADLGRTTRENARRRSPGIVRPTRRMRSGIPALLTPSSEGTFRRVRRSLVARVRATRRAKQRGVAPCESRGRLRRFSCRPALRVRKRDSPKARVPRPCAVLPGGTTKSRRKQRQRSREVNSSSRVVTGRRSDRGEKASFYSI